jgi:asparagine synthase (glutamine-hydrolysing)
MQDTLRSSAMGAVPFFDPRRVVRFLDSLPAMDESTCLALDGVLMNLLSACVLQEHFQLAIGDLPCCFGHCSRAQITSETRGK